MNMHHKTKRPIIEFKKSTVRSLLVKCRPEHRGHFLAKATGEGTYPKEDALNATEGSHPKKVTSRPKPEQSESTLDVRSVVNLFVWNASSLIILHVNCFLRE